MCAYFVLFIDKYWAHMHANKICNFLKQLLPAYDEHGGLELLSLPLQQIVASLDEPHQSPLGLMAVHWSL